MRNLEEYPITYDEAYRYLEKLKEEVKENLAFGDNRLAVILWIKEQLYRLEDLEH